MSENQMSMESFYAEGEDPVRRQEQETMTAKKAAFNRQYQKSCLQYGCISTGDSHPSGPLCIARTDQLSNESVCYSFHVVAMLRGLLVLQYSLYYSTFRI